LRLRATDDREAGDPPAERVIERFLVGLDDEVNVVGLDREVDDLKGVGVVPSPLRGEHAQDHAVDPLLPKRRQSGRRAHRDVNRESPLVNRPPKVGHARSRAPRSPSPLPRPAPPLGPRRKIQIKL
jgi:hypothetical protein